MFRSFLNCLALVLAALCGLAPGRAQTGITVAGSGYRTPGSTITAAPGQVLTVSVFGIAPVTPNPIFPVGSPTGLPTVVAGISVNFIQGPVTVQLAIRGVQQTPCPSAGACSPATTLTLQIPYELDPASATQASLSISLGGSVIAQVGINGVTDSVHVIDTCDQTGIYLSLAYGLPPGSCVPMVMHAEGPLVSAQSPATAGETLILWAYGLGAINQPVSAFNLEALTVQPFNLGFSYYGAARFPLLPLAQEAPSYAGLAGGGVYQILFVVPPRPADLSLACPNLQVLLAGPSSADSAQICVQ